MTTPYEAAVKMPQAGDPAPQFKLAAYPQGTVCLDDYMGKKNVILAFYPKDDTPGCTKEMCSFSADLAQFASKDTVVLGISCDSVESHQLFAQKHGLLQVLLTDSSGAVGQAYGTVREGRVNANRVLFVIDKKGIVRHVLEGMPSNTELLAFLDSLK